MPIEIDEQMPPGTLYMLPSDVKSSIDKATAIAQLAFEAAVVCYFAPLFLGRFYPQAIEELMWLAGRFVLASQYSSEDVRVVIKKAGAEKRVGCITNIGESK